MNNCYLANMMVDFVQYYYKNSFFTEPSSCDLIEEFLSVDTKNASNSKPASERIVDVDNPPSPPATTPSTVQFTRKQLALKILALKVASTLHWNLGRSILNLLFDDNDNIIVRRQKKQAHNKKN